MRARLLLIEDDPSTGAALQKVLRAEGHEVDLATRGDDGLARARQQNYDLVLTDFKLPGLSGLELVAQLHAAKPKLAIVLMTARPAPVAIVHVLDQSATPSSTSAVAIRAIRVAGSADASSVPVRMSRRAAPTRPQKRPAS